MIDGIRRAKPTIAFLDSETYTRTQNGERQHNVPKWNWDNVRKPSDLQKRKLVALALSKVAKTIFTNHLNKFNDQVYLQMDGGPIGDDATTVAAELVMFIFVFRYKYRLMKLDIYCDLILLKV